ncbi:60S ribosomal protein L28-like [Anneissia japonica]|uniref:60S ribosomal protein L28-like n=1 Tax=Anneissia japonica TaxID=1529436 RepID=UPI0014258262|nr:60S ribosomal protein L28-like [Anneissia japonica]XP_033096935.1 60S ribosomal protein L28-like [Anneissia japonica]
MSGDLQWMMIRNNSASLLKGINGTTFSLEPNNLLNRNSKKYNGLVNRKTVGVEAAKDGKGVVLVTKKLRVKNKPAKWYREVTLKKDSRRALTSIRHDIKKHGYRRDLKMAALRRASAILRSQRPVSVRKTKTPRGARK